MQHCQYLAFTFAIKVTFTFRLHLFTSVLQGRAQRLVGLLELELKWENDEIHIWFALYIYFLQLL